MCLDYVRSKALSFFLTNHNEYDNLHKLWVDAIEFALPSLMYQICVLLDEIRRENPAFEESFYSHKYREFPIQIPEVEREIVFSFLHHELDDVLDSLSSVRVKVLMKLRPDSQEAVETKYIMSDVGLHNNYSHLSLSGHDIPKVKSNMRR